MKVMGRLGEGGMGGEGGRVLGTDAKGGRPRGLASLGVISGGGNGIRSPQTLEGGKPS